MLYWVFYWFSTDMQGCSGVSKMASSMYAAHDIEVACASYGTGPNRPDQILYESFVSAVSVVVVVVVVVY